MFSYGNATWVDEVTARIAALLTAANVLPKNDVVDYLGDISDLLESPPGKKFARIMPVNLPVIAGHVAGAGFGHTNFDATWHVDFCLQLMERDHRTAALMSVGNSKSMTALVRSGIAALQGGAPAQAADADVGITLQPIRLIRADFNPRRPAAGWAHCQTSWEVLFRSDFS